MGATGQCTENRFQHRLRLSQNVVVPKSQYVKSSRLQAAIPPFIIVSLFNMLSAVKLEDKLRFQASEVCDVAGHWNLSSESMTCKLPSTQTSPEVPLGVGRVVAQRPRSSL